MRGGSEFKRECLQDCIFYGAAVKGFKRRYYEGSIMTVIKKKSQKASVQDLVAEINRLAILLEAQNEGEAAADLREAGSELKSHELGSEEFKAAIDEILEAFDGEHELMAYTYRRESDGWSVAEELYLSSINVLNLAKRFAAAKG